MILLHWRGALQILEHLISHVTMGCLCSFWFYDLATKNLHLKTIFHHLDVAWWLQEFFLIFEPCKPLSPHPLVSYFVMEKCSSLRHSWVYNCLWIFSIFFFFFSAYKTGMNRRTDLYLKENEHIRKWVFILFCCEMFRNRTN